MAVDIKLKRSHTHSNIPTTSDLSEGEFAVNTYDGKMYMRDGSNNIVTVGNNYATDYESSTKTFYVTVASSTSAHVHNGSGSSSKYKVNGVFSPYLRLIPGITYKFDQADSSNANHPFRFYLDEGKSTAYTTGVTTNGTAGSAGAYTQIVVTHSTPAVLHYQCSAHSLMGWAAFVHTDNLTAFDTGDLTEGSNLYFTNARADARVNAVLPNTDSLSEGSSNLYHTTARVQALSINNVSEDTSPQLGGALDLNSQNITGTGNISTTGDLTLTSTDTGNSAGPIIDLVRDSSSPADADYLGQIKFKGDDDGGSQHTYAKITGKIADASAGTEDGIIEFANVRAGSNTVTARLKSDKFQLLNSMDLEVDGNTTLSGTLNGHTIPGGSGTLALTSDISSGAITVQDEGSGLSTQATTLNFVGTGVVASGTGTTKTITINSSGGGGGGGSGESVSWSVTQSSHGLAVGDVIYNNGTNYVKAQSNSETSLGLFVVSAVANTNTFTATFSGKITLSSLTAGQFYFVSSTSAGDFTTTEPTGSNFSNPILFALSTTEAVVLPYRPALGATGAGAGRAVLDVFSKQEVNQQVSAFAIALG